MEDNNHLNFQRISKAIDFIQKNKNNQPSLDEIAKHVQLSPFHFQRLFKDWAGITPKQFLQYLSIQHAKEILSNKGVNVADTTYKTGLSSTSRLHDLFVKIEGMTPGEYKNQGENLTIKYSSQTGKFGPYLIASTKKGICYLGFNNKRSNSLEDLKARFPKSTYINETDLNQKQVITLFNNPNGSLEEIKLHIKGTDFQIKVWEALLKIPFGALESYGEIAKSIDKEKASRAVGSAIGKNPIAFLIPCHRVIQKSGGIGGYMWGSNTKSSIIVYEAAKKLE